jgi:dUTP pyrophosphatase
MFSIFQSDDVLKRQLQLANEKLDAERAANEANRRDIITLDATVARQAQIITDLDAARRSAQASATANLEQARIARGMVPTLRYRSIVPSATLTRATEGSSGLDLQCFEFSFSGPERCRFEKIDVHPTRSAILWTGIAVEIPDGYEGQIRPRSSISKQGLYVHLGTIDSDYRGEIGVIVTNAGKRAVRIEKGARIAQLVISPVARPEIEQVEALSETKRGAGGFGSTGVK